MFVLGRMFLSNDMPRVNSAFAEIVLEMWHCGPRIFPARCVLNYLNCAAIWPPRSAKFDHCHSQIARDSPCSNLKVTSATLASGWFAYPESCWKFLSPVMKQTRLWASETWSVALPKMIPWYAVAVQIWANIFTCFLWQFFPALLSTSKLLAPPTCNLLYLLYYWILFAYGEETWGEAA